MKIMWLMQFWFMYVLQWAQLWLFPNSKCIIGIDILGNWQNSYILWPVRWLLLQGRPIGSLLGVTDSIHENSKTKANPRGITEICVTIKDFKYASIFASKYAMLGFQAFYSPVWLVQETGRSWRMTTDYHKFNKVVTLISVLFQMWYCCLSKLTHPLVSGIQQPTCKMLFFFLIFVSKDN